MKKYATIYYLLFVLIITGAFASMAQNAYGLKICGVACLGFFLTFLHEIFFSSRNFSKGPLPRWVDNAELGAFACIAIIFMARNFSIDFYMSAPVWSLSLAALLLIFSMQAVHHVKEARGKSTQLGIICLLYYTTVILFTFSLLSEPLGYFVSMLFVIGGVLSTIGFLVSTWLLKPHGRELNIISSWDYIGQLKNKSAILLIACLLTLGYGLLFSAGALPSLYYGTLPEGYHELVEVSTQSSDEEARNKPREFKAAYEKFVDKYSPRN